MKVWFYDSCFTWYAYKQNRLIWSLSASLHLLEKRWGETLTFHFLNETNPNQSRVIKHHNDDISFWIQLSVRPQFIWHPDCFSDIYKGNQCALWFQSSFSLTKADKQCILGRHHCKTIDILRPRVSHPVTHTHTHLCLKKWMNSYWISPPFFSDTQNWVK